MEYPVYFPRSGKTFSTPSGCSNHISKGSTYKNQKDAYHDVYSLEKEPSCAFCNNPAKFISFSSGYKRHCNSEDCKHKFLCETNKEIAKKKFEYYNEEFINFVKKNIEEYREIVKYNKPYFDPFFKKYIDNPICFLRTTAKNKEFDEERICVITGENYKVNLLRDYEPIKYFVGSSKKSRQYRQFSVDRIMRLLKLKYEYDKENNFFIKSDIYFSVDSSHEKRFICDDKEIIKKLRKVKKGRIEIFYGYECFSSNLKTNWFNLSNFIPKDILITNRNEKLYKKCEVCQKEYEYAHIYYDSYTKDFFTKKIKGEYSCSEDCYMELLKSKKEYYEYPEETKIKQSESMKLKIENGEWTPNASNTWCKSRTSTKDGKFHFRSTWEAVFFVYMNYTKGVKLNYENIRIRYINENGINRVYLVDFEDPVNKVLYEVKPKGNMKDVKNSVELKEEKAKEWCNSNHYKFKYITEEELTDIVTYDLLTMVTEHCNIDENILFKRMSQFLEKE